MLDILRFALVNALGRHQRRLPGPSSPARCIISDLPPEILGKIFLHCLPIEGFFSPSDAPLLLVQVCRSWREVALLTPLLWLKLPRLHLHLGDGCLQLLKIYLKKSAKTALSITLELAWIPDDSPFLPLITPYLSRSQHLSITYVRGVSLEPCVTHNYFPLLENLELFCRSPDNRSPNVSPMVGLEGIKFPWFQLMRLTIQFHNTIETLTLLRNCSSLEVLYLGSDWDSRFETSPTPSKLRVVHHRLRTITFEDAPAGTGLFARFLSCLVTPTLSTLEFIRTTGGNEPYTIQLILSFIRNSSAELASLTLRGVGCSPQDLIDLSTLIPMVTELNLHGIRDESLRLLTIKPNSPHGVLFPCLKRLVIGWHSILSSAKISSSSNMFHSRLYLAPNTTIIENMFPLEHAEMYLQSFQVAECSTLDFGEFHRGKQDFQELVQRLQWVYLGTIGFNKKGLVGANDHQKSLTKINRHIFPAQRELGYCAGRLPTRQTIRFFRELDVLFAELEKYHITHALEILENEADTLMRRFSCLPETAFLHDPTYEFHIRAARLLKKWQPMISEYKAKDRWTCEYNLNPTGPCRLVHRRGLHL
ncbi:hypothetical protein BD779DRAFT_482479 [Infundibulicybe gibba]|nr:hypothetical protein BD779DRAFT_482479 [Infundibulicybe gibba]